MRTLLCRYTFPYPWYAKMSQVWYTTYRATSSRRLADTTGAVRALAGVFWGAASLAPNTVDAFIERAMAAEVFRALSGAQALLIPMRF